MTNRIVSVKTMENMNLVVYFQNGVEKKYNIRRLYNSFPQLRELELDKSLFEKVIVDVGGYGISWNDELDIDAEEIWENGIETGSHKVSILSKLGYDVARARELKHMTQNELSKITGIYQSDISKIERGIANPSVATLKRIADGMNMELKIEFINIK